MPGKWDPGEPGSTFGGASLNLHDFDALLRRWYGPRQARSGPETMGEAIKRERTAGSDPLAGLPPEARAEYAERMRVQARWRQIMGYMALGITEHSYPNGHIWLEGPDGNKIETD